MKIKKLKASEVVAVIIKWIFLVFMAVFALAPLVQVLFNSFRTDAACKSMPLGLPESISFINYIETWEIGGYATAYINTIIMAFFVIVITLTVVGLGAYAISKLQFKLRGFFDAYFFVAISIPAFLYIVPDYSIFRVLGLTDSRLGLSIIYIAMNIPFNMLLLKTFLEGIPRELEEAAKMDGCSEMGSFLHITLPIAKPMFLTIAILVFVNVWNEYLWGNTFISTDALKTVATRFVRFTGQYGNNMARIYTASMISIAPIILLYVLFSRRFIEGMTSGSVKG